MCPGPANLQAVPGHIHVRRGLIAQRLPGPGGRGDGGAGAQSRGSPALCGVPAGQLLSHSSSSGAGAFFFGTRNRSTR
jgi:hypothetical protein